MATFNPKIRTHQVGKDGKVNIIIAIYSGKTVDEKIGIRIFPNQWDFVKSEVSKNHPNHSVINNHIKVLISKMERYVLENPYDEAKEIKQGYAKKQKAKHLKKKKGDKSFHKLIDEVIKEKFPTDSPGTAKHRISFANELIRFKKKVSFNDLDRKFIDDFKRFCVLNSNSPATIFSKLDKLKSYVNVAVRRGYIKYRKNPFLNYPIPKITSNNKGLTKQERELFFEFACVGSSKLALDLYKFSFYALGMRFADALRIENSDINNGYINYEMGKNKKEIQIKVSPPLAEIIKQYESNSQYLFPLIKEDLSTKGNVFDQFEMLLKNERIKNSIKIWLDLGPEKIDLVSYLDSEKRQLKDLKLSKKQVDIIREFLFSRIIGRHNQKINRLLKPIGEQTGASIKTTFHTSRHSFTTHCNDMRLSPRRIQGLLAHSSLEITEGYMNSMSLEDSNQAIDILFG